MPFHSAASVADVEYLCLQVHCCGHMCLQQFLLHQLAAAPLKLCSLMEWVPPSAFSPAEAHCAGVLSHYHHSTIADNKNYTTPAHRDLQDGPECNLMVALSLQDGGGLWIEGLDGQPGNDYQDIQRKLIRGELRALRDLAVMFLAHACYHAGQPWCDFDCYTFVAYTVYATGPGLPSLRAKCSTTWVSIFRRSLQGAIRTPPILLPPMPGAWEGCRCADSRLSAPPFLGPRSGLVLTSRSLVIETTNPRCHMAASF